MNRVNAKLLRDKTELIQVPPKPGVYRWYAPIETLKSLGGGFEKFGEIIKNISQTIDVDGKKYYLIYIGTAHKKTSGGVRKRLNWHISQHHTEGAVRNGTLSTFRQSVSSLVAKNQNAEDATNKVIDSLVIEYECFDMPLGSPKTARFIDNMEKNLIEEFFPPLNIMNNNPKLPANREFKKFLSQLRGASKAAALG